MMEDSNVIILMVLFFLLLVVDKWAQSYTKKTSRRLAAVKKLNEEFNEKINFSIDTGMRMDLQLDTKAQYDRSYCDDLARLFIADNENYVVYNLESDELIQKEYAVYQEKLQSVFQTIPAHRFKKKEKLIVDKVIQSKPRPVTLLVMICYTSPAGRNSYSKHAYYDRQEILNFMEEVKRIKAEKSSRHYQIKKERSLMTASLRFKILQRDDFTCQFCGSKASDGVKLHIDHIHPVSKGGKTVEENLMVLCDRCNLGKSDQLIVEE